jgi:hypothetical protein
VEDCRTVVSTVSLLALAQSTLREAVGTTALHWLAILSLLVVEHEPDILRATQRIGMSGDESKVAFLSNSRCLDGHGETPCYSQITSMNHPNLVAATEILLALGLPKGQINARPALTLLALANVGPANSFADVNCPLIGITPIMTWVLENYDVRYAPNTRGKQAPA